MTDDPFAALRESRTNEDEEVVRIGNAPTFDAFQRWFEKRGDRNADQMVSEVEPVYYFSGPPLLVNGRNEPSPVGETDGHDLVSLLNASRADIPGPHDSDYVIRCPTYDLGRFDSQSPRLDIAWGIWWPDIELVLVQAIGGGFTHYWNRLEHHFLLNGSLAAVTYWFNEFHYAGQYLGESRTSLLDPGRREVALIVTGSEDALAAIATLLADLALSRSQADQYVAPELTWNHHESVEGVVETIKQALPKEPRPRTPTLKGEAEPAPEVDIAAAEATRGVRLPGLMRELLLACNGGSLDGDIGYDVNQHASRLRPFGGLSHAAWFFDGVSFPDPWKPIRPLSLLVPFTGDGHSDVCLDYRRRGPNAEPQVTLVDTEGQTERPVANSFAEYVSLMSTTELSLPSAPTVSIEQVLEVLRSSFSDIEIEDRPPHGSQVKINDQELCRITDVAFVGYEDCPTTIRIRHPDHAEDLVRTLAAAGLLEGSLPKQRWDPDLWTRERPD